MMGPIFSKSTNARVNIEREINETVFEPDVCCENNRDTVIDMDAPLVVTEPPQIIPPMERESADAVILDLEQKGYNELPNAFKKSNNGEDLENALMSIITNGADEFKERTGRPMSYAEMRAAWG
jgi:hypothetical protein